jgi:ankyrin repeat protein
VALQIDEICSQPTELAILRALENFPANLAETFNRELAKLRSSRTSTELEDAVYSRYSVKLFCTVTAARRPLTLEELREAVGFASYETVWYSDRLVIDMRKLLKCCGSFLVVDEETFTVRFIHRSAQQFLCSELVDEDLQEYEMDLGSADLNLGEICVTYLHSERHVKQLVQQQPQLTASSATLKEIIPDSNIAEKWATRLLKSKEDVTLLPSLDDFAVTSPSYHPENQGHNSFLSYALGNWLCHTRQLNRKAHSKLWPLWVRLVIGEVHVVRLPWAPENCVELGPAFVDYVLQNRQWNLIFVGLMHAKHAAVYNLRPVLDALSAGREKGVSSSTVTADEKELIRILEPFFAHEPRLDWDSSVVHAAASYGYVDSVQCLLDHGADINLGSLGHYGTALNAACSNGHEKTVKLLLESGADINLQGEGYDTALIAACRHDRENISELLLENGADINHHGEGNDTALIAACRNGHEKIVELLLENSADINLQCEGHDTALIAACRNGREKVVELLLENGANVNLYGKEYATALNTASLDGLDKTVKLLLKSGAEVNLQGGAHGTPLMAASFNGHENVVKLLLENGANVNLEGGMYGSALATAKAKNHSEIVKLLLEHSATENTREQIFCPRSERHTQLVEQESQPITSSATLRKANVSSNLVENLVSIHDPASMSGVVEEFAGMLLRDEDVVKYVEQGFATIDSDMFERNLNRFMRWYVSELRTEADSRFQRTVSRIAYKYSAEVTRIVRKIVVGVSEDGSQDPASDSIKDQTASKLMLGRHLTQEQPTETFEQVYTLSEDEHENDEVYFEVEEPYLRNLGNLTEFLISSAAFMKFKARLGAFVKCNTGLQLTTENPSSVIRESDEYVQIDHPDQPGFLNWMRNILRKALRPSILPGSQRVEWICVSYLIPISFPEFVLT